MFELRTERLLLREWLPCDLEPWAELNADPIVMEHFPALMTREQSDDFASSIQERMRRASYGLWAVEVVATGDFIGFTGLNPVPDYLSFTGVEIGWRLRRNAWGHGYATEAARTCLDFAFTTLDLDEVVSFTATTNLRSQAVMQRIGMTRELDGDFDHPKVPPGPLRRHVLYRIHRPTFH